MPDRIDQVRGIHLVTGTALCGTRGVESVVMAAVKGGVRVVQLREKMLDGRDFVARARALKALLAPLGVPLIINDRLDICLLCEADGLHVGQRDVSAEDARRWLPHGLIGLSVESTDQMEAAELAPVDYCGASPVFTTMTKADAAQPLGLDGLRALCTRSTRPVVAIGGISHRNARSVIDAGAVGLAVVSEICSAADPQGAAALLCKAWET